MCCQIADYESTAITVLPNRPREARRVNDRPSMAGQLVSARDLDIWAHQKGVEVDFSRSGKPTDNNFIESFNGKFRSECLNTHGFLSLDDARQKLRIGVETTTKSGIARSATRRRCSC